MHSFLVPTAADWPADSWGNSIYNWHNAAGDVGWNTGNPVSAVHFYFKSLNYDPSNAAYTGLQFALEQAKFNKHMPDVVPGQWYDIITHIVYGRTDGTTNRPGSAQVWINGNSTPVVDISNVNTIQKEGSKVQQWVTYWDGGPYHKGEPCRGIGAQTHRHQVAATRFGHTLQEAINDTNISLYGEAHSVHIPGQPDHGASSATQIIPGRSTADFQMPSSLGP